AACSVAQADFDANGRPDVRIKGDAAKQVILIEDSQTSYRVRVDCNGDGDFTDAGDIDTGTLAFEIETFDIQGGGKDVITYRSLSTFSGASKNILVTLGPATALSFNNLTVETTQPVLANSSIVVDVLGSAGPDSVGFITDQAVTDSSIVLRGDLGTGDDFVFI